MREIRIVGPGKTRENSYPVCKIFFLLSVNHFLRVLSFRKMSRNSLNNILLTALLTSLIARR